MLYKFPRQRCTNCIKPSVTDLVEKRYQEVEAWLEDCVELAHPLHKPSLLLRHKHHSRVHRGPRRLEPHTRGDKRRGGQEVEGAAGSQQQPPAKKGSSVQRHCKLDSDQARKNIGHSASLILVCLRLNIKGINILNILYLYNN